MNKSLKKYIEEVDKKIDKTKNLDNLCKEHLTRISFLQHERLIVLLVVLFFALFTVISFLLSSTSIIFFITTSILCFMLLCYLFYYFSIEKNLKKLYEQYDKMV